MRTFLITILSAVLGGLLLKAGEIPLTRWMEGAPLRATAVVGPYNDLSLYKSGPIPEENPLRYSAYASIIVENISSKKADEVRLSWPDDALGYKAVVVHRGTVTTNEQGWRKSPLEAVLVPPLSPGEKSEVKLYLNGYSAVETLRKSHIFSSIGSTTITIMGVDPDGSLPPYDSVWEEMWSDVYYIAFAIILIISAICIWFAGIMEKYVKLMLLDQDFYLEECQRFHTDPKAFQPPIEEIGKKKLPKT